MRKTSLQKNFSISFFFLFREKPFFRIDQAQFSSVQFSLRAAVDTAVTKICF